MTAELREQQLVMVHAGLLVQATQDVVRIRCSTTRCWHTDLCRCVALQVTDIIKGVTNIVPKVQAVLVDMESKYKKIWDTDKDAYMRRYKKAAANRDFDGDIRLYLDHIDEIRSEESVINVEFLHIDQQPLKAVRHHRTVSCAFVSIP